jgi:hypothetical protein
LSFFERMSSRAQGGPQVFAFLLNACLKLVPQCSQAFGASLQMGQTLVALL